MKFTIGGVPEHYNLPWHWAWENNLFDNINIKADWKSYPAGTGAMCRDLREGKLDIAVLLTEGIIADIGQGNPSKIIALHVESPLRWGIFTGADSEIRQTEDLKGKKYAISRRKSGSHLMPYVNARSFGWTLDEEKDFVLVENLEGARVSLGKNEAQAFFWEKFTTKHLVDNGEFRYLGDCYTPWPPFVVAAREEVIRNHPEKLAAILDLVQKTARELAERKDIISILCKKYNLKEDDAREWFAALKWNYGKGLDENARETILEQLKSFNLVDPRLKQEDVFLFMKPEEHIL